MIPLPQRSVVVVVVETTVVVVVAEQAPWRGRHVRVTASLSFFGRAVEMATSARVFFPFFLPFFLRGTSTSRKALHPELFRSGTAMPRRLRSPFSTTFLRPPAGAVQLLVLRLRQRATRKRQELFPQPSWSQGWPSVHCAAERKLVAATPSTSSCARQSLLGLPPPGTSTAAPRRTMTASSRAASSTAVRR